MTENDLPSKHLKTLQKIKNRPVLGTIPWDDIKKLFVFLGAEIQQRNGSRIAVILKGNVHVFHEPHPKRVTDKGAVNSVKRYLASHFPDLFISEK